MDRSECYQLLGLREGAAPAEVKETFRTLAKLVHPDLNPSPEAHDAFVYLTEAYRVLREPESRALEVYDEADPPEAYARPPPRAAARRQWADTAAVWGVVGFVLVLCAPTVKIATRPAPQARRLEASRVAAPVVVEAASSGSRDRSPMTSASAPQPDTEWTSATPLPLKPIDTSAPDPSPAQADPPPADWVAKASPADMIKKAAPEKATPAGEADKVASPNQIKAPTPAGHIARAVPVVPVARHASRVWTMPPTRQMPTVVHRFVAVERRPPYHAATVHPRPEFHKLAAAAPPQVHARPRRLAVERSERREEVVADEPTDRVPPPVRRAASTTQSALQLPIPGISILRTILGTDRADSRHQ